VSGTVGLMRSLAPNLRRTRVIQLLLGNTQAVRLSVSHGRLDAARALRSVKAVVQDANPQPTPTPTPRPSPTPTPSTPPQQGEYVWRGWLSEGDDWDRTKFYLRGRVRVQVSWWGGDDLSVYVENPHGDVIRHVHGDFEMNVEAGDFTFSVAREDEGQMGYKIMIEYGLEQ
jgi:hypothetical protein